ncbi:MAG: HAMP domain-containing histidine kinase [Nitrososphaeraceae archaeon]|nr:HAMP domain-containing histidine kinase [Nitrososphaeraceae archaeon]MBV9668972.1 HAMP domain-containing histidine kinase [Nitrososphaeraceae archaeon]
MTINPLPPSSSPEKRSEILYGVENAVGRGVYFMSNVKKRMDIYFDHRAPSIVVEIPEYKNGYIDIRKRGGKIRAFTEITNANIHHCKELIKLVDELRHLNGVKGGIAVSESEYMATTILEEAKPLTQVIFSSVKEVVEQGQYIFDTLWNTAIPAEQKIRELEEGVVPIRTRLVTKQDEIIEEICRLNINGDKLSICSTFGGMQMSYKYFFDSYKRIVERKRRIDNIGGGNDGLRWIIDIDKDKLELVRIFLEYGIQIKHIKNMPSMNFGVSDKEVALTIEKMEGGNISQSFLISNEPLYVSHFNSLFEELWKNGIDAKYRIKAIEDGVDNEGIEIIQNPAEIQKFTFNLLKSAAKEILILYSSANAFHRQEYVGAIQFLKEAAYKRGINVRILTPADDLIVKTAQRWKERQQQEQEHPSPKQQKINIRFIEAYLQTKVHLLIADRKFSLAIELKDDASYKSYEAVGLATYSNSKPTVLSYVSIFESLWKQTELYEGLKEIDKLKDEFINVAAHELRTPIQPILGLSSILRSQTKDSKQQEILDVIVRNAKRLQRLSEDILDVTKIESHNLILKKEIFNLNDIISNAISDITNQIIVKENKESIIKIEFINSKENWKENAAIVVEADKGRISQVISNLLNNAVKFTNEGTIRIITEKNNGDIVIGINDTGTGIDPDILPRLFTKFTTKSNSGTGLGLFISKSIIKAHDGRIWAENNTDGKGATFYFSIPQSR